MNDLPPGIYTDVTDMGLRWAATSQYRVVAHADGGHSCQRWTGNEWGLFPPGQTMPREVEDVLCGVLGIKRN